ncbi:helix-turn-helix domain-containing protein [Fidelibacter multiformis]|uniref:helix-turn-helix domain-containing protein n=1 Tax=Fidelibacter multiformis TaxID=3377529 RepID=UPI0037DC43D8
MKNTSDHTENSGNHDQHSQKSTSRETENTYWELLKKKRIQKKITLEDLSLKTKINVRYFEAIERGDFSALPETYIRLFLKSYAQELDLDFEEILSHTPESIQKKPKVPVATTQGHENTKPLRIRSRRKRNPLLLLSGVIIIAAAVIVFEYYQNTSEDPTNTPLTDTLAQTTLRSDAEAIQVSNDMENLDPDDETILTQPYTIEILPEENLIYLLQVNNERSRENLIQKNINHSITLNSPFKLKIFQPDKCRIMINKQILPVETNKPVVVQVNESGKLTLFGSTQ